MLSVHSIKKPRIISALLPFIIVFLLASSFFLFYFDGFSSRSDTKLPLDSHESLSQDQAAFILFEGKQTRLPDNAQIIAESMRGLRRNIYNSFFLWHNALVFVWLSVYAYIYFHKKSNKSLPAIALSMGGHAPPAIFA